MISKSTQSIAILAFHKIGEPPAGQYPTWNYIPTAEFEKCITDLDLAGWTFLSLTTFLDGLLNNQALPPKSVLLTFDDGYKSFVTTVMPILADRSIPAVMFVPTQFVGGYNAFDRLVEPEEQICSWDELRHLESQGVSVESHCVTHPNLSLIEPENLAREISDSKREIDERLGKEVQSIAYPYGHTPSDHRGFSAQLANAGYGAGFLYGGGLITLPIQNPYFLSRIAMGPDTDVLDELGHKS
ncbi:MAG: polysaccharide deacetylase family protein [Rhodothermia bacterium]|nr:polysaccharide deacetylase family protein [Rhodothermia bacterium]